MRGSPLIVAACAYAAQEASDVTTIFVGGLPSSGTRVAAEALAHLGARGWGDAAWDSGVGCCEAMGLLARRVRSASELPSSRSFLSRSDTAALDGILRKQLHTYRRGRLTKFHARTADGGDALLVKEPEISLLLPWLPLSNASYVHVVRDGRDQALGASSGWPLELFGDAIVPDKRPSHLRKLTIWAKWNAATEAALATLGLPSVVVRLEDLRGKRAAQTLRRMADAVLPGSDVNVESVVEALSGDLGTSGKEGTGSLAPKDAVAKWRRSRHRFDAMDDLSKRALRKYGYSVRERRRRKPP
jgi:hypothetical protein